MSSTGRHSSARLQERAADEPQPAKSDAPRRPSSIKRKVIDSPPRERKKRKKKRAPSTPPDSGDSNSEFDGDQTDPLLVTRLNLEIVDEALDGAWEVYPNRQMCVIFDPINPLRQFKRGVFRDDESPFPDYSPSPELDPDVMETDEEPGLQQYAPTYDPMCVPPTSITHMANAHLCGNPLALLS